MKITIPERVIRIRYDYEGGAPWSRIEIQMPYIGKKYAGCKGIIIGYTLSEDGKLHSTVLVGKKCKGGIGMQEILIKNEDVTVHVEGWSPRHKKTDEHSALEKRQALEEIISCENVQNGSEELKKSLLYIEDVDNHDENIHTFKLCVEVFIKMPDGTIMLWDRAMSNLCREERTAKAKKRSNVVTSREVPEKYPRLEQQIHASHLVTEGSSEYRNLSQPHDMVLPTGSTFQEIRTTEQLENIIPYECRSTVTAEERECIPTVVEDYEEPTVADSRQVNTAVGEHDQNFAVATRGAQHILYSAEIDLISEYAERRLDSVHDRHESTALASFTAPVDAAPILSERWDAIPIDSSFDENITITSAEERDCDISEYAERRLDSVHDRHESTALPSFTAPVDAAPIPSEGWDAIPIDSSFDENITITSAEESYCDIHYIEGISQSKATTSSAAANNQRLFVGGENAEIQNLESMLQCETINSPAAAAGGGLFSGRENSELDLVAQTMRQTGIPTTSFRSLLDDYTHDSSPDKYQDLYYTVLWNEDSDYKMDESDWILGEHSPSLEMI